MHSPITIDQLDLVFSHKICFHDFSTTFYSGDRIAVIGRNGSGKSTLLTMLYENTSPHIYIPTNCHIGYIPQWVYVESLSGGEAFQSFFYQILRHDPNVLLLDEPTNHLDHQHRHSLFRQLDRFQGTLLVVSHDEELLNQHFNVFWHIHEEKIYVFRGNYGDYLALLSQNESKQRETARQWNFIKHQMHEQRMQQQEHTAKKRQQGKNLAAKAKWSPIIASQKKSHAQITAGSKMASINEKERTLQDLLVSHYLPKIVLPQFFIHAKIRSKNKLITISQGSLQFNDAKEPLIQNIHFSVQYNERVAIMGKNGSGKSSFIQAIVNPLPHSNVTVQGEWNVPPAEHIGYLDQHYHMLEADMSVFLHIQNRAPHLSPHEIRDFLNNFLFRKDAEVYATITSLSGGEKARLLLAMMALKNPPLLILDEITNNLDIETKHHLLHLLNHYKGGMILISHDTHFLKSMNLDAVYEIENQQLSCRFID